MGEAIAFEDVRFAYAPGGPDVFGSLSLRVAPGELTALLGPNGSGKSTWVRLAAGLLRPLAGSVRVLGRDAATMPARERARTVAVVPQESVLAFDHTVREVVAMGRAPHLGLLGIARPEDARAVDEALDRTGLTALAARPFRTLSGGERQRAIIARALAQAARVLLLDEPTASLDLRHRVGLDDLVRRLHRERGLTVVVVTHDLDLAARSCDRIVLLAGGAVLADGPPRAVLRPDVLERVYGVRVAVLEGPSGRPHVVPLGD